MSRRSIHIGFLDRKIEPAHSLHTIGMVLLAGFFAVHAHAQAASTVTGPLLYALALLAFVFPIIRQQACSLRAPLRGRDTTQGFLSASPMNLTSVMSSAHPYTLHKEAL